MTTKQQRERLLDAKATAEYLGVTIDWLARRRMAGALPRFVRLGRMIRYETRELDRYIEASTCRSTADLGLRPADRGAPACSGGSA